MKYVKRSLENGDEKEITYEDALDVLLGTFKDNEMTRSMLTIPNRIYCRYSEIDVYDGSGLVPMAGLYNLVPDDVWAKYNPDGTPK